MKREDLVLGREYYTASDEAWTAGHLGGRMRVTHLDPLEARNPSYRNNPPVRCDRLTPDGRHIMQRGCIVFIGGFRGTWEEVGAPIYADYLRREADAKAAEEIAETLGAATVARLWVDHRIPAIVVKPDRATLIGVDAEKLNALLDRLNELEKRS